MQSESWKDCFAEPPAARRCIAQAEIVRSQVIFVKGCHSNSLSQELLDSQIRGPHDWSAEEQLPPASATPDRIACPL